MDDSTGSTEQNEVDEDVSTSYITGPLHVMETDQSSWSRLADQPGVTIQTLSEIDLNQLTLPNGQPITLRFNCNLAESLSSTTLGNEGTDTCQIQVLSENSDTQQNDSNPSEIETERISTDTAAEVINMTGSQQKNVDFTASLQSLLELINYQHGSVRIELPAEMTPDQSTALESQQINAKIESDPPKPNAEKNPVASSLFDKNISTDVISSQQTKFVSILPQVNQEQKNLKNSYASHVASLDNDKLDIIGESTVSSDIELTEDLVQLHLKRSNDTQNPLIHVSLDDKSASGLSASVAHNVEGNTEAAETTMEVTYGPEQQNTVFHSHELYSQLLQEVVSHSLMLEKIMVFCKSSDLSIINQDERYDFSEKLEVLLRVIDHLKQLLEQDASVTKMKCDKSTQTEKKITINSSTMCEIIIPSVSSVSGREIRQPGRFNPSMARLSHMIDYDDENAVEMKRRNRRKRKLTQRARQYMEESLPSSLATVIEDPTEGTNSVPTSCPSNKSLSEPLGWTHSLFNHINLSEDSRGFYNGQSGNKKSHLVNNSSSQEEQTLHLKSNVTHNQGGNRIENGDTKEASNQMMESTDLVSSMSNDSSGIETLNTAQLGNQLPVLLINHDSSVMSVVPQNVLESMQTMQIGQAVSEEVTEENTDSLVTSHEEEETSTDLVEDPAPREADDTQFLKENVGDSVNERDSSMSTVNKRPSRKAKTRKSKKEYEEMAAFKFFCKKCSFKTKRQSHYHKHLKLHEKISEMYYCKFCDFKTIRNGTLRKHEVTHSQDILRCQKCKYVTDNTTAMEKHNKLKHNNGVVVGQKRERMMMFQCKHCNHKSSTILQLQRHMHLHLRHGKGQTAENVLPEISFECNQCKYKTKRKEHFVRHKNNVHSDHRPYLCDTCGRSFKRTDALSQHKLIHIEKAHRKYGFICQTCNKGFRSRSHLQEHMAMHSNTRQFLCDICGAKFKTKSCQQKHVKSIHQNPRAFSCNVCDKRFNTSYALRRHEGTHERPHQKAEASTNIIETQSYLNQNVNPITTQTLTPQEFVQVQDIIAPSMEESYDQSSDKLQQAFPSLQNENATAIMFLSSSLPASWT